MDIECKTEPSRVISIKTFWNITYVMCVVGKFRV